VQLFLICSAVTTRHLLPGIVTKLSSRPKRAARSGEIPAFVVAFAVVLALAFAVVLALAFAVVLAFLSVIPEGNLLLLLFLFLLLPLLF
jgi:uncharacterized RDD family membrane protein YckC